MAMVMPAKRIWLAKLLENQVKSQEETLMNINEVLGC